MVERIVGIHLNIAINRTYEPFAIIRVKWWNNGSYSMVYYILNTLRTSQNFANGIFQCILFNEKIRITMKSLLLINLIDNK